MGILATHWFDSVVGTSFSFPVSVLEQDEIYSTTSIKKGCLWVVGYMGNLR